MTMANEFMDIGKFLLCNFETDRLGKGIAMTRYELDDYIIKIYFDREPSDDIETALRMYGWREAYYGDYWYHHDDKEKKNEGLAKLICGEMNLSARSSLHDLERYEFAATDIIIKSNSFYCNKYHEVEDVAGLIDVYARDGRIVSCLVPLGHCKTCNAFYILEETFKALKQKGLVRCQVLGEKDYKRHISGDTLGHGWKTESILKVWGYNVGIKDDYTDEQRHAALENIIDNCPWITKDRVLSYLDFFIRLHFGQDNIAVGKWREDRKYIANYRIGAMKRMRVKNITTIERNNYIM